MTSHKIRQYLTFNMGKSYTCVDVQVTDEGGRLHECLLLCISISLKTYKTYYKETSNKFEYSEQGNQRWQTTFRKAFNTQQSN